MAKARKKAGKPARRPAKRRKTAKKSKARRTAKTKTKMKAKARRAKVGKPSLLDTMTGGVHQLRNRLVGPNTFED